MAEQLGLVTANPLGLLAPGLRFDQRDVIAVDLGNDQRHVGLHAQGAGIGNDGASGVGELGLQFAGDPGIERGENNFRSAFGRWRARRSCWRRGSGMAVFSRQRAASA